MEVFLALTGLWFQIKKNGYLNNHKMVGKLTFSVDRNHYIKSSFDLFFVYIVPVYNVWILFYLCWIILSNFYSIFYSMFPAKNSSYVQIKSIYAHRINITNQSLTGIKFIQVNIKSGYKSIFISWYIVGFPDKNVVCLYS